MVNPQMYKSDLPETWKIGSRYWSLDFLVKNVTFDSR
jgi:hypothetical protein